jgi:hypothetical protein
MKNDVRGQLIPIEFVADIGFIPERVFSITGVRDEIMRGDHAHRTCYQVFQCVNGIAKIHLDDGTNASEICLAQANQLLVTPPMNWAKVFLCSTDTVLTVFASHKYDSLDYISDYAEFMKELNRDVPHG